MTLQAHVDATPLSHRAPLLFSLSLEPSSSSAAHLLTTSSPPVKVNASLSRHTRTTPIANPNSGRSFEWAGVRILAVDLERVKDDDWRWQGMIQIPEGECTVESKGVAVTVRVQRSVNVSRANLTHRSSRLSTNSTVTSFRPCSPKPLFMSLCPCFSLPRRSNHPKISLTM